MHRAAIFSGLVLSLLFSCVLHAFDEREQSILAEVDRLLPKAGRVLEEAVNINSGTMNFAGVRKLGQLFEKEFAELGFEVEWIDGSAFGRAGHLLARRETGDVPRLLLIGHLDTVFAVDDPFQHFRNIDETRASGPGVIDMKGGDVIMLTALGALRNADVLDRLSVRVVMTGDEEDSGLPLSAAREVLIDAAKWADIALGFEDGDGDIRTAVTSRRGSISWELQVSGKPAHSSQIFQAEVGDGAIYEAARILDRFREQLSAFPMLTINPGVIVGGTRTGEDAVSGHHSAFGKSNVIAQTATVRGDLRALSLEQQDRAMSVMREIVGNNLPHTSASLTFDEGYPPLAPSEGNGQLLALYSQISEELGLGPVLAVNPRNAGAADISFTAGHTGMALDGLGLMGAAGHTRDEMADMTSFEKNIKKAALLMYRLSRH